MSSNNTCFVISPIGEEGSDIRRHADDVFDLLVEPALEPFHFTVVRADKIPGPSSITEDVIRLVQESSLCVADLTDRNPNVFYECGRRHETGKPMILIIRKGDRIPFDLAGIRTITYELSDPRNTRESVIQMQNFVREIEKSGFAEVSSGATLTTVIDALARIERKLNAFNFQGGASLPTVGQSAGGTKAGLLKMVKTPTQALRDALSYGNLPELVDVLPRAERSIGFSSALITGAIVAAINGELVGAEILSRAIQSTDQKVSFDLKKRALYGLVQYYIGTERAADGAEFLPQIAESLLKFSGAEPQDLAFIHNQIQMLYYGAQDFPCALESAERAIKLNPREPSYLYNASMVYEKLKLPTKAIEAIELCLSLGTDDADHLAQAFDIYSDNGMPEKADATMQRLQELDPARAALQMMLRAQ